MNKKYIDFVPSSRARGVGSRVVAPRRKVVKEIREEDVVVALPNTEQFSRTRVVRAVSKDTGVVQGVGRVRGVNGARGVDSTRDVGGMRSVDGTSASDALRVDEIGNIDGMSKKGAAQEKSVVNYREDDAWRGATAKYREDDAWRGSTAKYREDDAFSIKSAPKLGVVEDYKPKFVNTDVPKRPLHNETTDYTTIAEAAGVALMNQGKKEIAQTKTQKVKRGLLGRKKREAVTLESKMTTTQGNAEKGNKVGSATRSGVKTSSSIAGKATSNIEKGTDAKRGMSVGRATNTRREMNAGGAANTAKRTSARGLQVSLGKEREKKVPPGATFVAPRSPFINQDKVVKRPLSSRNVYQKPVAKEEKKGPVTIITNSEKDSKVGLLVTIILTIVLGAAAGTVAFLLLPK